MALEGLTSEIIYKNILSDVDLQYVITSGNIKENIIVKSKQDSYNYSFTLKLNNLEAEKATDGSISIYDPNTGEVLYIIPSPVVYDANGEYADTDCASYMLTETGTNMYSLVVSAASTITSVPFSLSSVNISSSCEVLLIPAIATKERFIR